MATTSSIVQVPGPPPRGPDHVALLGLEHAAQLGQLQAKLRGVGRSGHRIAVHVAALLAVSDPVLVAVDPESIAATEVEARERAFANLMRSIAEVTINSSSPFGAKGYPQVIQICEQSTNCTILRCMIQCGHLRLRPNAAVPMLV